MAHKARQQVPADDARRPRSHEHRGSTKIFFAQCQQLGTHGTGEMSPFDHAENQCYAKIDKEWAPAYRQYR